jgi:hypothetical protein
VAGNVINDAGHFAVDNYWAMYCTSVSIVVA